jgi:hypothetical protein
MQEKLPKHPEIHKLRLIFQFLQIRLTHKISNPHTNKQEPRSGRLCPRSWPRVPFLAGCVPDLCLDALVLETTPDIGGGRTEG